MSDDDETQLVQTQKVEDALDRGLGDNEDTKVERRSNMVHIQFQQRTTRKCISIIQGLPEDLDFKKLVRHFKKTWNCNGAVIQSDEWGQVIQVQGDIRKAVAKFLIEEGIARKEEIKIHGF